MMIEQLERNAVKRIAKLSPWLAPVTSAYLVYRSTIEHLGFPIWVALVAAITIETLGLSTMYTRMWLVSWNGSKNKTDKVAPTTLANLLVVAYFVITIVLIVVLDVLPAAVIIAPALFPLLAAIGTMNLVLIAQQEQREHQAEVDKTARKEKRAQAKHVIAEPEQTVAIDTCWCGYIYNGNGVKSKAAHVRKHYTEIKYTTNAATAQQVLMDEYPGANIPDESTIDSMWQQAVKTRKDSA